MLAEDKTSYLLTYNNGIASYFHALLCMTGQTKKAEYFRDTVKVWNPASTLDRSFMSTSAAFYIDEQTAITKYSDLPYQEFKPLMVKIFHDWYTYQLRKQSKRYKKHIQYKLKDFTNNTNYSTIDLQPLEDIMSNNSIYKLIADFMDFHATERERFIFRCMVGLDELVYDDEYRYVLNYPGKRITRQTYINHKKKLIHKFKGLTLRADVPQPAAAK